MKPAIKPLLSFLLGLILLASYAAPASTPAAAATIPTISIVSVVKDKSVTIRTNNYPAHVKFTARMGKFGTLGINGIVVGTTDSGNGGSFEATYNIPADLKGLSLIAIRLDGTGGYFSYNFFENATTGSTTPAPTAAPTTVPATAAPTSAATAAPTSSPSTGYSGFPTFSISSVVRDTSVTIKTKNLPPNQTFTVRMGAFGTLGINGTKVTTTDSGKGGAQELTYAIPAGLKGSSRIAIRMESPQGYFAYNWFFNNSTSGGQATPAPSKTPGTTTTPAPVSTPAATKTPGSGYSGFPTFTIVSVVKDGNVTIKGKNFPANQTFTVRMGAFGTLGINGTKVTTTDTGKGGALDATYNIPAGLKGDSRIAIRLESSQGYFAYNWFYNVTAP